MKNLVSSFQKLIISPFFQEFIHNFKYDYIAVQIIKNLIILMSNMVFYFILLTTKKYSYEST